MTLVLALALAGAGWMLAFAAALCALRLRAELGRRMELVARAAHELRGPLTAARLGVEAVAREASAGRRAAFRALDLELARAGVALEDLSAALHGARGPVRVGRVEVPALLADSLEALRPLARARGVSVGLTWSGKRAVVAGDRLRLAQATGNLIANAIEHGAGHVEVGGRAEGDRLEIAVADEGPGLPAPVAELTRRPRRGRGPRGRGLAIAAEIARRHGGELAASGEGESRLALVLPLARD